MIELNEIYFPDEEINKLTVERLLYLCYIIYIQARFILSKDRISFFKTTFDYS